MWILIVLAINFQQAPSQIAVEFNSKKACQDAADLYTRHAYDLNANHQNVKIRAVCAYKGETK